jgi:eukaryotic-like serine/threonine-protein kinase
VSFPPLSNGFRIADTYEVQRVVGEGAMGVVYAATAPNGESVAVKVLVRTDAEGLARFDREIATCEKLHHANVVPVFGHGVDLSLDAPYLVMPLLAGGDLGALLARTGALPESVAIPLIWQACQGVAAVHEAGVVHRDVKPSNFLLDESNESLVVRVADFGLATATDLEGKLTRSGVLMGTPHYISPEQSQDPKSVDGRTDVWSLGMVLFHMLAGRPAFDNAGAFMQFLVQRKSISPVQNYAPWVSPRLARALHGALLRAPDARWPSVREFMLGIEMAVGFDAARRPLHTADLAGLDAASKAQVAERAELPLHWEDLLRG